MTYSDDFIRVQFPNGTRDITCADANLSWPPPELITLDGIEFRQVRYSKITDRQRGEARSVIRSATYVPVK